MTRSRNSTENSGTRVDDPGGLPGLSLSGMGERFIGVQSPVRAPGPRASADITPYGNLKDHRVNRWTVRDREAVGEGQAVGVDPV